MVNGGGGVGRGGSAFFLGVFVPGYLFFFVGAGCCACGAKSLVYACCVKIGNRC